MYNNINDNIMNLNNINKNQKSTQFKKNNQRGEGIMFVKSGTYDLSDNTSKNNNLCDKNSNKNINVIIKYKSYQKNMGIKNKRLQTILETVKEVSNSIVDSSELSADSQINNDNINNNVDINNEDIEEMNNVNLNNIFINEQKFQNSENRINDSENNTGSAIATAAVYNTKKSLYFSKSEKTD